jgi:hypothetical protein
VFMREPFLALLKRLAAPAAGSRSTV